MAGSSEVYGYLDRNIWLKREKGLHYEYEWDHDQDHGNRKLKHENLKLELESHMRGKKPRNIEIQEFIRDTIWDDHTWHYHFNEI